MEPQVVDLPGPGSFHPHCCVVSGRRDEPCVDFGDPCVDARGPHDPRIYIRRTRVEEAARLLGWEPGSVVEGLRRDLEETAVELGRLRAVVAAGSDLHEAEDRLRAALGPAGPETADPDPGIDPPDKER